MYRSAQEEIVPQLRRMLLRSGIQVGAGAGYPRVEIHSWTEQSPLDKGMAVRQATCTVESMSTSSKGEALAMNSENLSRLVGQKFSTEGFRVFGIVPDTLTDMEETTDTQTILYRELQTLRIFINTII